MTSSIGNHTGSTGEHRGAQGSTEASSQSHVLPQKRSSKLKAGNGGPRGTTGDHGGARETTADRGGPRRTTGDHWGQRGTTGDNGGKQGTTGDHRGQFPVNDFSGSTEPKSLTTPPGPPKRLCLGIKNFRNVRKYVFQDSHICDFLCDSHDGTRFYALWDIWLHYVFSLYLIFCGPHIIIQLVDDAESNLLEYRITRDALPEACLIVKIKNVVSRLCQRRNETEPNQREANQARSPPRDEHNTTPCKIHRFEKYLNY